eukprot:TRINITY_DN81858_c0_g1_i1.p2 TRINITY_DN81858_c0_g1~~TRINITY_DN81858_c0_g1_i1.p2  ORF type:complete len:271 (-),score=74.59 TRINITY_DN81858_c0_g1_i1:369-1127(-)
MPLGAAAAGLAVKRGSATVVEGESRGDKSHKSNKAKSNGKGAGSGDRMEALVNNVARLALSTARDVSVLNAAVLGTVLFQKETPVAAAIIKLTKDTTTAYAARCKEVPASEKAAMGSPHVFVWLELIANLPEILNSVQVKFDPKVVEMHQAQLADLKNSFVAEQKMEETAATRAAVASLVKVFKEQKCWDPTKHKVTFAVEKKSTAEPIINLFATTLILNAGGIMKMGQAPMTDAERKIRAALEKVGRIKDE